MTRDREEFTAIMALEGMDLQTARSILRDAATVQRLAVAYCSRPLDNQEEAREARARHRITVQASRYQMVPVFSGDPRGATVKLRVPSGKTNDWGNTGICVPTRNY